MTLCVLSALRGLHLRAPDGYLGWIEDVSIDERTWSVRHLVIRLNRGWNRKEGLIRVEELLELDWASRAVRTRLGRKEIASAPSPDTDQTVNRAHEAELTETARHGLYGDSISAGYPVALAGLDAPQVLTDETRRLTISAGAEFSGQTRAKPRRVTGTIHLRSGNEITGYGVEAADGPAGYLADLVMSAQTGRWRVHSLVVQCGWIFGRRHLVPPEAVRGISWEEQIIDVASASEALRRYPLFDGTQKGGDETPDDFYDYYGRPVRRP